MLFRALLEGIPEYRATLIIFSPRCALYALSMQKQNRTRKSNYPCRGGIDFFFINSQDADTYPCGYRGSENIGKFWNMASESPPAAPDCQQCEWECFRDPSELLGPFVDILSHPVAFFRRVLQDPPFYRLWSEDVLYYWACRCFNGRVPPDAWRLGFFKNSNRPTSKGLPFG